MTHAKPFLIWAGGKTQLLPTIANKIPETIRQETTTYIEPFLGAGAMFFWAIKNFKNLKTIVLNDLNQDLIQTYVTIKTDVAPLITILSYWESEFLELSSSVSRKKEYYYSKRDYFNFSNCNPLLKSALFIFLNRTCFNGLYRVNKQGHFNVPMGDRGLWLNSSNDEAFCYLIEWAVDTVSKTIEIEIGPIALNTHKTTTSPEKDHDSSKLLEASKKERKVCPDPKNS